MAEHDSKINSGGEPHMITLFIVGFTAAVVAVTVDRLCFRKPEPTTPNHARLTAKPGATLDLVSDEGMAVAKIVLHTIQRDRYGTSAQFVDYFQWKERNTYRG